MLILTTNAFAPDPGTGSLLPDWPGPQVLVVQPDSGLDRSRIEALNEHFIVIEWLEPPAGFSVVLRDAVGWLADRLQRSAGPLLCLDRPPGPGVSGPGDLGLDPARVPPDAVQGLHDAEGRLVRLVLGEMVATNPLLPGFMRMIEGRGTGDSLFVELLTDALAWALHDRP